MSHTYFSGKVSTGQGTSPCPQQDPFLIQIKQIIADQHGQLERKQCVLEPSKDIEAVLFFQFFKPVNQSVAVDVELTGGLGQVEVVVEEGADDIQRFLVKGIQGFRLQDLVHKDLADVFGELVDQPADAEMCVPGDMTICRKDPADLQGGYGFLVGTACQRKIRESIAVRNSGFDHRFCIQRSHQHMGQRIRFFQSCLCVRFPQNSAGVVAHGDQVIPGAASQDGADNGMDPGIL